ncbi:uncharacterized protein EV154DRAFT_513561 [Mucor mucedo]|uniref:uncharacterized protein n=1 Tax=Mucor mucedo TaxID=29922 RepID=UPI00221F645E|nr:uncharacterized protein EV154DRAFT_513561 [Mucor mucedo]KAI7889818.1 hypothetical protein EV154DRAFT_513561 [Mucor mucedo]
MEVRTHLILTIHCSLVVIQRRLEIPLLLLVLLLLLLLLLLLDLRRRGLTDQRRHGLLNRQTIHTITSQHILIVTLVDLISYMLKFPCISQYVLIFACAALIKTSFKITSYVIRFIFRCIWRQVL